MHPVAVFAGGRASWRCVLSQPALWVELQAVVENRQVVRCCGTQHFTKEQKSRAPGQCCQTPERKIHVPDACQHPGETPARLGAVVASEECGRLLGEKEVFVYLLLCLKL